jgi:hypothetical protein
MNTQRVEIPVVERAMILVLERTQRVRHALDRIGLAVRPVVHRIDAPLVTGALMRDLPNPVHDRVTHVHVAGRHVDFRPEHVRPIVELPGAHPPEEIQIFVDRAIPVRAFAAGLGERAAVLAHLIGRQAVDVRFAGRDELFGPLIELIEVVGRVKQLLAPIEAEPSDVAHDLVDVLLRLLDGIGVVESEVAIAAEFLGDAKIDADGFGMTDVELPIRLRWKPGDNRSPVFTGGKVVRHDLADEVARGCLWTAVCTGHGHEADNFSAE